jgi:hypothetical protein
VEVELADRIAVEYGKIIRLRLEYSSAMAEGEYSVAIGLAVRAAELSMAILDVLSDLREAESLPYVILAFATMADLGVARAADGDHSGAADVLRSLRRLLARTAPDETEQEDIDLSVGTQILSQRMCPHGRASYTGHCLAKPPCPLT